MPARFIVAVVVTYKRPVELERLLASLRLPGNTPDHLIVVDNAAQPATRELLDRSGLATTCIDRPDNPGCGAAWKQGAEEARVRFGESFTHVLYLDDDAELPEGLLERLLNSMTAANAGAAVPLLEDANGRIWAFPEPADPRLREEIRKAQSPAECLSLLGPGPHEFVWCAGACLLVTRNALDAAGYHRTDFRILGEDLEYGLRLHSKTRCVFFPELVGKHLPPTGPADPGLAMRADRAKFLCLLQNIAYISTHVPHRAHLRDYLAGNFRRFVRTHGMSPATLMDAGRAFWLGAVKGLPAGDPKAAAFHEKQRAKIAAKP